MPELAHKVSAQLARAKRCFSAAAAFWQVGQRVAWHFAIFHELLLPQACHEHDSRSRDLLPWHDMTDRMGSARCGHLAHKSQHGNIANMTDNCIIVLLVLQLVYI